MTVGTVEPLSRKRTAAPSDRRTFDELCKLLGVDNTEKWCDSWDRNYIPTSYVEDTEEDLMKREEEDRDEAFTKYQDAVVDVAEELFDKHALSLVPVWTRRRKVEGNWKRYIIAYRIKPNPGRTWQDAARRILETLNGMGPFYFASLQEFRSSGPYTYREAVLSHLGWIPCWYPVYGEATAKDRVYRRLR